MKEDFILPDIGEGIVECELVEWLVAVGDQVAEDQPVADVQTDKALVQIPAKHGGRITSLYVQQGDIAKVHAPLFQIEIADSSKPAAATEQCTASVHEPEAAPQKILNGAVSASGVLATPAVRRLARENNINLTEVKGTGPAGRVLKEDMLRLIASPPALTDTGDDQAFDSIPVKGIRAAMAKQMAKAVSTIPHFTYSEEIDLTASNQLRRELNAAVEEDKRLTLMSFFIKALSLALKKFPIVNSHMTEAGDEILQHRAHNIGMAVDSPAGLLVPNIKGVNHLSLQAIASEVRRLTDAGRAGRLSPADLSGGTITISNIGAIGGTVTSPIINIPEVAIVGIGRIQQLPRVVDGNIVVREIIQVSWSGDHRVLDGGTIARFNNEWRRLLEMPQQMLLELI